MFKKNLVRALSLAATLLSATASAMVLDWSGGYRFEWTEVDRPSLASPSQRKAYGLNYLYLSPKIIAVDGVNIISRFDVLNSSSYPNSQLGEIWGIQDSSAGSNPGFSSNQGSAAVNVSQLYLNVNQEYGALLVGRAPFEFGLGMTYNAGKGAFDHWYDTRDMVAYKFVVDDWFFMPVLSRKQSGGFGQGGTISALGFQLQYENQENKSLIGVYKENIKGVKAALNYSNNQIVAFGGDAANSDLDIERTNFVLGRGFDNFGFKIEAGFASGETGITKGAEDVRLNGYGIAAELYIPKAETKWDWKLKLGMATGDDATSTDFGGYAFNRNYDAGMLLFNHRLGQRDFMNTDPYRSDASVAAGVGNSPDDESISNAMYVAPSVGYEWSERLDVRNTIVYGQLFSAVKNSVDSSKDLGLEWDIELVYKPSEKIQWVNQLGVLMPGSAWKNGADGLENGFTYGFTSKAAISF